MANIDQAAANGVPVRPPRTENPPSFARLMSGNLPSFDFARISSFFRRNFSLILFIAAIVVTLSCAPILLLQPDEQVAAHQNQGQSLPRSPAAAILLDTLKDKMRDAEDAAERYKQENRSLNVEDEPLNAERFEKLNAGIVLSKAKALEARYQLELIERALSKNGSIIDQPSFVRSETISRLGSALAAVWRDIRTRSAELRADHPDLVRLRERAAELKSQINAGLRQIASDLRAEMNRAESDASRLERRLTRPSSRPTPLPEASEKLQELERAVAESRANYRAALNRESEGTLQRTGIAAPSSAAKPPPAARPGADGLSFSTVLMLALGGGLLLGTAGAFAAETIGAGRVLWRNKADAALLSPQPQPEPAGTPAYASGAHTEAEKTRAQPAPRPANPVSQPSAIGSAPVQPAQTRRTASSVPPNPNLQRILGTVPSVGAGPESMSFVLDDRNSTRSQSVFKILADLNPGQVNRSAHRILITAPSGLKKNKSAIALNLTFAAGLQGDRVLLIDADLTERHLTRVFIEPASFGLMEVLGGIADPEDVIVNDPNLPVAFFPCAPLRKSASLTISGQALSSCLDKLSDEYDLILINGGKLGAEGYITQLATASDQLVLVTDSASVKSGGHRQAIQAAQPFADKFAGTIVLPDDAP